MKKEITEATSIMDSIKRLGNSDEIKYLIQLNDDIMEIIKQIHGIQEKIWDFMPIISTGLVSKRTVTDVIYSTNSSGKDFFVLKKDGFYVLYNYREKASKLRDDDLKFILKESNTVDGLAKYIKDGTRKNMFLRYFEIIWDGGINLGSIDGTAKLGKALPIKVVEYRDITEMIATHYQFGTDGVYLKKDNKNTILDFGSLSEVSSLLSVQQHIKLHTKQLEEIKESVHKMFELYKKTLNEMNEEFSLLMVALKI